MPTKRLRQSISRSMRKRGKNTRKRVNKIHRGGSDKKPNLAAEQARIKVMIKAEEERVKSATQAEKAEAKAAKAAEKEAAKAAKAAEKAEKAKAKAAEKAAKKAAKSAKRTPTPSTSMRPVHRSITNVGEIPSCKYIGRKRCFNPTDRGKYCKLHTCPQPGCNNSKRSTNEYCEDHSVIICTQCKNPRSPNCCKESRIFESPPKKKIVDKNFQQKLSDEHAAAMADVGFEFDVENDDYITAAPPHDYRNAADAALLKKKIVDTEFQQKLTDEHAAAADDELARQRANANAKAPTHPTGFDYAERGPGGPIIPTLAYETPGTLAEARSNAAIGTEMPTDFEFDVKENSDYNTAVPPHDYRNATANPQTVIEPEPAYMTRADIKQEQLQSTTANKLYAVPKGVSKVGGGIKRNRNKSTKKKGKKKGSKKKGKVNT